jgi:hypothetical protein
VPRALTVVARGDAGDDIITLNYIGQINGALDLTALGGGGRNRITRNITPLPGSTFGAAPAGPSTVINNPPDGGTTNTVNIDLGSVDLGDFIDSVTNLLDRTQVDQVVLEIKNLLSDLDLTEVVERIDELLVNQEATVKEILVDLLDPSSNLLNLEIPDTLNGVLAGSIGDILRSALGNVPNLNQLVGNLVGGDLATDLLDGVLNGNLFDDGLVSELIQGLLGGDTLLDVHAILDDVTGTIGVEDLLGRVVGGDTLLDRLTDLEIADLLGRLARPGGRPAGLCHRPGRRAVERLRAVCNRAEIECNRPSVPFAHPGDSMGPRGWNAVPALRDCPVVVVKDIPTGVVAGFPPAVGEPRHAAE